EMIEKIKALGIVPVVKIDDEKKAVPLALALCRGGLPIAEITFRTDKAEESIRRIAESVPEILVGAGTVLSPAQVDRAKAAGAKFIVSPGLNPKVVEHCQNENIPIFPGCCSPSDIEKAMELGLRCVKFFPAEQSGGIAAIKAMAAPYGDISFLPTGGIKQKNLNDYLSFERVVACGGSWMADPALIEAGDFATIEELTRSAVHSMLNFELAHLGINGENEAEAENSAKRFSDIFGFAYAPKNSSIFSGSYIEAMKAPYLGLHGHIAIRTNYIGRAVSYLKSMGVAFNEDSAKYDAKGKLSAIYLDNEIGGFAVHLVQ
ncbi:MAG: bifunctional 4-hydroxy-2-oxoglutarate aldolase/2-dehydro-3-deoxy-phosphogluconate aldolase, partial [Oscillospiraceae bacterium]|nr:bifunctional 4-hydroxy-2-oxoglutarate aldolase/2-dehydro-3-deoxy-phosphogluconate aldolase [Oscillospiraceae bacterium]